MFSRLLRCTAPPLLLLLVAAPAPSQPDAPITAADLRRHIDILASDEFEGRAPATAGETRTINYISAQFQARGVEPAGGNGGWFQPVRLVERAPQSHDVRWTANGRPLPFDQNDLLLIGRESAVSVSDAPVVFAGHGARMPDRGIDQLAGADLRGAVALILMEGPDVPGFPSLAERSRVVSEAGAAAVIAIVGDALAWPVARRTSRHPVTRLESYAVPQVSGFMPIAAAQRLVGAGGGDLGRLLNDQPGSSFRAVALPIRASFQVSTAVRHYASNNVVGRLRGSAATGESLLYLGHWDHFGICRPAGEPDRICNGAVDNASGIATMLEVAGRLARAPRPPRDILFLATTAEEVGLLGAEHFAAQPAVPIESIVAAINIDTVAIHPAGQPVAVIGRGIAPLDSAIDDIVRAAGRRLDSDEEAAAFVERQDGWAFARAGVPAIMVGGSFSDMALLQAFLNGPYHAPSDEAGPSLVLDGAAEDANLLVALGRRLADPARYRRPRSAQP